MTYHIYTPWLLTCTPPGYSPVHPLAMHLHTPGHTLPTHLSFPGQSVTQGIRDNWYQEWPPWNAGLV